MTKMNGLVVVLIIGLSSISHAMVAPWYRQVRQFDAAVEAVADRFQVVDSDELLISSIVEQKDDSFVVVTDKATCQVEIVTGEINSHNGKPMPVGGMPSITGKITKCAPNKDVPVTKSYDKVSAKMDKAAAKSNFITGVAVTGKKGTIKLTFLTHDN